MAGMPLCDAYKEREREKNRICIIFKNIGFSFHCFSNSQMIIATEKRVSGTKLEYGSVALMV